MDLRDARIHAAVLTQFAADSAPSGRSYGTSGQQGGSAEGLIFTDVDVMVVFTGAARAGAGGESGVLALIDIMVARANAVFINSRVGLRLRLVHTEEVNYSEPNNINTDLDRLSNESDGHLDSVHATRQNVGADVVSMLTETTGGTASGLAWLYSGGLGAADYGFNVVQRAGCESTFVHEIGHNFGCEHDRENTDRNENEALYPYAFGQTTVAARGRDEQGRILFETTENNFPRFYRQSTVLPMNYRGTFIASSGQVGGADYDFGPTAWRAARWNGGSSQLLSPLASFLSSWGRGVNRSGAVAGLSSPTANGWSSATARATLWAANSTTPINIHPAEGSGSVAHGINDHGEAIGLYHQNSAIYAFYWNEATGSLPLQELVIPEYTLQLAAADAINHRGEIAVRAWHRFDGKYQPAILTPVAGLNSAHWSRQHFSLAQIEDTGVAGDADDPDGDGLPNLIERAFGLNPLVPEASPGGSGYPQVGFEEGQQKLTLRFRKMRPPSDITYTVESTSDLTGAWSAVGAVAVSRTALNADWDEMTYQSVDSPTPGSPVFMRVRVGR